jgi:hypothetical protein
MIIVRRRRPLARAAIVGGGAYALGKSAARGDAREEGQEERIRDLEAQGAKGGSVSAPEEPDITAQLKELADLKSSGAITQDEFESAKKKLLS